MCFFFFQAEDGIRDLVRSRGLGDVYKRQDIIHKEILKKNILFFTCTMGKILWIPKLLTWEKTCLLYTSDAADERSSVDLGGRRIIKKKKTKTTHRTHKHTYTTDTRYTSIND